VTESYLREACELKAIFGWVNGNSPWTRGAVKTMNCFAFHTRQVDWIVKSANYTMIPFGRYKQRVYSQHREDLPLSETVLDMVER
jgi:hypothetical protein